MINIDNLDLIIFDLGGVLLNINYRRTEDAMKALGVADFNTLYSQAKQSGLFDEFEKGNISVNDFVHSLRQHVDPEVEDQAIIGAWNAMLLDFPIERLELLKALKNEITTVLFSNTNEIHLEAFQEIMNKMEVEDFNSYFHKTYYSHQIGYRKPDPEGFRHILDQMHVLPEKTLFIDDSAQHVEGARSLGIHAIHLTVPEPDITALFPDIIQ